MRSPYPPTLWIRTRDQNAGGHRPGCGSSDPECGEPEPSSAGEPMGRGTGRCYDRPMPWPRALCLGMVRESRIVLTRWVHCVLGVRWGAALRIALLIAEALPLSSRPVGMVRDWEISRQRSTVGTAVSPPPRA